MKMRSLGMIAICAGLMGCGGGGGTPKAPSEAELKAMNDKMKKSMEGMNLPAKLNNPNDPMKSLKRP